MLYYSLFFLEPRACGRPEQPPNSTMIVNLPSNTDKEAAVRNYQVGTSVEYTCDTGSLLIGPASRTCLDTGFYNEFPPVCKSAFFFFHFLMYTYGILKT